VLELYQTEWCPASRRVRQRLTELGLDFVARQVPAEAGERAALGAATGATSVPVLCDGGHVVVGADAILAYLDSRHDDPPEAAGHRARASRARRRDLEEACPPAPEPATR
jgi:glutathione S-transferase